MSLLQRIASSFRKSSRMLSVNVYRRADSFFVVTKHGCDGSDPCIVAGPLEALPLAVSHEELGAAIFRGLKRTSHHFPYPANQQDWTQVSAALLGAAKCKSWSAFAKTASDLSVEQIDNKIVVQPSMRERNGGFTAVADRKHEIEAPTAAQLGSLVAAELQFAATRDDA